MPDTATPLLAFSNEVADLVERAAQSVVTLRGARRWPLSGLHWRSGVIVTAEEGLEHDDQLSVVLPDGRTTAATLAGRDPTTDIAVLRFQPDGLKTVEGADAAALRAGNLVVAVGRTERGPVASLGIAAVASGAWQSRRGGTIDRLIRLDLRLSPAGEGGAMVDASGRILGMTVPGPRRRVLGIPASTIDRVADQLLAKGHIARGYLGAGLTPVRHGAKGVLIVSLDPAGPATAAGLMVGDLISHWNGQEVARVRGVMQLLGPASVGTQVALKLVRGGTAVEKTITIGERPRR
jgi:S1-C subfamily serine protease